MSETNNSAEQGDIFTCLVLSDRQPQTQRYIVNYRLQHQIITPENLEPENAC